MVQVFVSRGKYQFTIQDSHYKVLTNLRVATNFSL